MAAERAAPAGPIAAGLVAEGLTKRFGDRLVLRNLNFEVRPGEVVAIVGANGAGKSTLLRLVCGLLDPTRGSVTWQGKSTRGACALAAPDAPLYRELTCYENLHFFARGAGGPERLLGHLQHFDLEKRAGDLAGDLSSGLRARLHLAVAAIFENPVLLLDEPSANLDQSGRDLVAGLLQQQRQRGITLLATNDPRDLDLCDRKLQVA